MIITNLADINQYRNLSSNMAVACDYLKSLDLSTVTPGEFQVTDGVHGSCIEYVADGEPGTQFENHHRWIDIHFVTKNRERMAVSSVKNVEEKQPYDSEKDIAFFRGTPEQIVELYPGNALITFPEDLHQPKVRYDDKLVRKVCMKVQI